jgi:2-polyprenyl-3-methyl-5-hydroxy-6-metoxy-1,4-benzoquinol methylase
MENKNRKENKKVSEWGSVATWYDDLIGQEGSDFHQSIIMPGIVRLLKTDKEAISGKKVVDLACGQGVLCRYLANQGVDCVGVDIASELIETAKLRGASQNVPTYINADATKLLDDDGNLKYGLQPNKYDAVTIVLAIQNITPLSPVWHAANKLLKTGGSLIIVMMHPCFRVPKASDWSWNEKEHRQERVLWEYLSSQEIKIDMHPGKEAIGKKSESTTHYHRPLQAYINTLGNAKLLVDHIEEWVSNKKEQVGIKSEALEKAKKEFPMFLAIRSRKIG